MTEDEKKKVDETVEKFNSLSEEDQKRLISDIDAHVKATIRRMRKELFWFKLIDRLSTTFRPLLFIGVACGVFLGEFTIPLWFFSVSAIQFVSIFVTINRKRFSDLNYLRVTAIGLMAGVVAVPVFTADLTQLVLSLF